MEPVDSSAAASSSEPDVPAATEHGLRRHVASGVRWGGFDQVAQAGIRMGTTVVLSHLLLPADFGVMGLATVIIGFTAVVTGLGLGDALVQRKELDADHISSAFAASTASGLFFAVVVFAAAPAISTFFSQKGLREVLVVLSVTCVLRGLERTPNDLLIRDLSFRRFYLSSTIAAAAGGIVGIAVAVIRRDVWALVAMAVTESAVAMALGWVFSLTAGVWRPSIRFNRRALRDLRTFSLYVTATTGVGFLSDNADDVLVGKLLGSQALGYYSLAYGVVLTAIVRLSTVVGQAAYPAIARVRDDTERLRRAYLQANRYISLVCLPVCIGLAVTAPALVPVVFGARWRPAVGPFILLSLSGPPLLLGFLSGRLYTAMGKPKLALLRTAVGFALYLPAFVIGAHWGIDGVAAGFTIVCFLRVPLDVWLSGRMIATRAFNLLTNIAPLIAATVIMAAATLAVGAGASRLPTVARLALMVTTGMVTYVVAVALLERQTAIDAFADLSGRAR